MTRWSLLVAALLLAACQPRVPDSAMGVDDGDYRAYRAEQERRAAGGLVPDRPVISTELVRPGEPRGPDLPESARRAAQARQAADAAAAPSPPAPSPPAPAAPAPPAPPAPAPATQAGAAAAPSSAAADNPGISRSQDFAAVSAARTRQEDAEQLREMREEYQVLEAEELPEGERVPSIARFALSTRHPVGQKMYSRSIFGRLFAKSCEKFATPDDAQTAFLAEGGPKRDPMGLDPDGDGYACAWSPEPFRQMAR